MAATALRIACGYWAGCYRSQVALGVLVWLLQGLGWPEGTGMAATSHRGYWPGCYSPHYSLGVLAWLLQAPGLPGVLAWLLQAPGWPGCTGLAATGLRLAWGYRPGCYRP